MQQIIVPGAEAGRRIDKYLMKYFDAAPRSFIYKAFRKKNIKLCGRKAAGSELLKEGDLIELFFSDETLTGMKKPAAAGITHNKTQEHGYTGDVRALTRYCGIVYEDDNIIIADKRCGVLSQKAERGDYSLNEALLDYCGGAKSDSTFVPSVVNRIDRNTTGIVCFAKTYGAARELSRVFKSRDIRKYYIAAVSGHVSEAGHDEAWLKKDSKTNKVTIYQDERPDAEHIETAYRPVTAAEAAELGVKMQGAYGSICGHEYTLLKVELITGKSHQIRAHLASIGHALLGDPKYGSTELGRELRDRYGIKGQLLHAWELDMPETLSAPLGYLSGRKFRAKLPRQFMEIL